MVDPAAPDDLLDTRDHVRRLDTGNLGAQIDGIVNGLLQVAAAIE